MIRAVAALAAALALVPAHVAAQAGHAHPAHAPGHPAQGKRADEREAAARNVQPAGSRAYASPFADYRPFDPQEPAKGWRAANEEVREAGGHIGVMKSNEAAKAAPPKEPKR